jgi:NAD dependent epimerase/dehydratase family enzyme
MLLFIYVVKMYPRRKAFLRPWASVPGPSRKNKKNLDSRTISTAALAKAIAASKNKKLDFLVASGVRAYGKDFIGPGVVTVDQSMDISQTDGFLAEVSRRWKESAEPAVKAGNRVVNIQNCSFLSIKCGVLVKLYPTFFWAVVELLGVVSNISLTSRVETWPEPWSMSMFLKLPS